MTPVEILRGADALLAAPENWIKSGEMAATREGSATVVLAEDAVAFCVWGAIARVARQGQRPSQLEEMREPIRRASRFVLQIVGNPAGGLGPWNDATARTFAEVKSVLAQAIALAEKLS